MRRVLLSAVLAVALALAVAAPAAAHVTVQPEEAATGAFARFVVRVPNERDAAATVKVAVHLPEKLVAVSFQPTPGWRRTVERKPRQAPVDVFGEHVTDDIASVTWEGGRIEPGEFEEFAFSARTPAEPAARVRTFRFEGGQGALLSRLTAEGADDGGTEAYGVVPWAALGLAVLALAVSVASRRRT